MLRYTIAHFLFPTIFEEDFEVFPPHITLVPPFLIHENDEENMMDDVAIQAERVEPFFVRLEGVALFGENMDKPVSLVEENAELRWLHALLVNAVSNGGGAIKERQWLGENYRPHIAHTERFGKNVIPVLELSTVSMVIRVSDNPKLWRIAETFSLKDKRRNAR